MVGDLLPQLAAVQVERVEASGNLLRITARTSDDDPAACPGCGQASNWVHSRYVRHVADEAVGGRAVVIDLSVRRLYCENPACRKVTFVEQVAGLTRRYQRRTPALQKVVDAVAVALAGSAGAHLLGVLHHMLSWASVLNCLMRITLPARPAPRVLGIDEFALRKGHHYATILTDAATGERIEVLPDRKRETVTTWLKAHPGIEVVCRDGAGGFAQATTDADPRIVQVCDRWHLWHGLAEAVSKEVGAHSACWAKAGPPLREGTRAQTTRERWHQVHQLLDAGVLERCQRNSIARGPVSQFYRESRTGFNFAASACRCAAHLYGSAHEYTDRRPVYSSDMTDAEWEVTLAALPTPPWLEGRGGRPARYCERQLIDAVRYVDDSGCKWRQLPADFPPRSAVYAYFQRTAENGALAEYHDRLRARVRESEGRAAEPTAAIIDS
ncbi:ISL3 family transposase, partial [Kitasatospora sp. NPDC001159]